MAQNQQSVIIVGAGPAGCAAARVLAQAGYEGIICERGVPGKDKPCGDAYTEGAVAALAKWGLDAAGLAALGGLPYDRVILDGFGERYDQPGDAERGGWVIRRAAVDQWLREQVIGAGFPINYGTTVTQVRETSAGLVVTVRPTTGGPPFDLTCHAVILATGAANHLSQAWDIAGEPIMGASLSLYAQGAPLAGLEFRFADNLKPGYAWAFPMVTGLNIGVCALGPTSAATLRARAAIFAQGWSAANATWRGGGHALWSGNGTTWHHPAGVVSCGDAAGLTDPHSAEGITAALKSGAAAGAAIARFLKRRSARALASYSAWVKAFGTDRYQRLSAELLLWRIWAGA